MGTDPEVNLRLVLTAYSKVRQSESARKLSVTLMKASREYRMFAEQEAMHAGYSLAFMKALVRRLMS